MRRNTKKIKQNRKNKRKTNNKKKTDSTKIRLATHQVTQDSFFYEIRKTEKKRKESKTQQNHTRRSRSTLRYYFKIDRFYLLVGLVPCYLSAASFLLLSTTVSVRLFPLPSPFPWTPPTTDAWRFLFNFASFSCHLTMNRSASSRTPR